MKARLKRHVWQGYDVGDWLDIERVETVDPDTAKAYSIRWPCAFLYNPVIGWFLYSENDDVKGIGTFYDKVDDELKNEIYLRLLK